MTKTPSIVGYQTWRHLLFVHWRIEPQDMQSLLPEGLTVETFDNTAWLGVVPFSMEKVRPWWSPPVPGISWFLETNVRTYVRHKNGQSGVWFFTLDANHRLAVTVARNFWHLNYQLADLQLRLDTDTATYSGCRRNASNARYDFSVDIDRSQTPVVAEEKSLEHFLLERYHLFARKTDGSYLAGQVHHNPYQFLPAKQSSLSQTLSHSVGCPDVPDVPDHMVYSSGVDVKVSRLLKLRG